MIEVILHRRLSEIPGSACTGHLNGVPYSTFAEPAVALDYWWRFDDDPTMRPEFLGTKEAPVFHGARPAPLFIPFNTQGRDIRLFQIARTRRGMRSDPLINEARQYVLRRVDAVHILYGSDLITYGGDYITF